MHGSTHCSEDEGLSSFAFEIEMDGPDGSDCSILASHTPCSSDIRLGVQCDSFASSTPHHCGASYSSWKAPFTGSQSRLLINDFSDADYDYDAARSALMDDGTSASSGYQTPPCRPKYQSAGGS